MKKKAQEDSRVSLYIFFVLFFFLIFYRLMVFPQSLNNAEFVFRGICGKDLIDGLRIPFLQYRVTPYHGTTIFLGLCTWPLYLLFGDSFASLYTLAVLFSLAKLTIIYAFCAKFLGKHTALIAAFIYVCAPIGYMMGYDCNFGVHTDVPFFVFLSFFFFIVLIDLAVYDKTILGTNLRVCLLFSLFGLLNGIALFICLGFAPSIVVCLFVWARKKKRFYCSSEFFFFLGGFIVGYLPALINFLFYDRGAYQISNYETSDFFPLYSLFFQKDIGDYPQTILSLLRELYSLFLSWRFFDIPTSIFYQIFLLLTLLIALAFTAGFFAKNILWPISARREKKVKVIAIGMLLGYVFIYCILLIVHPQIQVFPLYVKALFPYFAVLIAFGIASYIKTRNRGVRLLGFFILACTLFSGLGYVENTISLIGSTRFYILKERTCYTLNFFNRWYPADALSDVPIALTENKSTEFVFLPTFGTPSGWYGPPAGSLESQEKWWKKIDVINKSDGERKHGYYTLLGVTYGTYVTDAESLHAKGNFLQYMCEPQYSQYVFAGFAVQICNGLYSRVRDYFDTRSIEKIIPTAYQHHFYREFGWNTSFKYKKNVLEGFRYLNSLHCSKQNKSMLLWGFLANCGYEDIIKISRLENMFSREFIAFHIGRTGAEKKHVDFYKGEQTYYVLGKMYAYYQQTVQNNVGERDSIIAIIAEYSEARSSPDTSRGLGFLLGIYSGGMIMEFDEFLDESELYRDFPNDLYIGFGMSLVVRFGFDTAYIESVYTEAVPSIYKESVVEGIEAGREFFSLSESVGR